MIGNTFNKEGDAFMKRFQFIVTIFALFISFSIPSLAVKPNLQKCEEIMLTMNPTVVHTFGPKKVEEDIKIYIERTPQT